MGPPVGVKASTDVVVITTIAARDNQAATDDAGDGVHTGAGAVAGTSATCWCARL